MQRCRRLDARGIHIATAPGVVLGCLMLVALGGSVHGFDELIDSPMYRSPHLPGATRVLLFPEEAKALWLRQLRSGTIDLQHKAAEAIALAHRRGFKGFDQLADALVEALEQPAAHPLVRLAVARTLVTLDARSTAAALFRHSQAGPSDLRLVIEPALARWDHGPARDLWLGRLNDPATPALHLSLAIQGLAQMREERATTRLRALALQGDAPGPLRLEAARALGVIRATGLEQDAAALAGAGASKAAKLAAGALLRRHAGAEAIAVLQRLGAEPEPAVAEPAVARLLELDPGLIVPSARRLLASPDANLRRHAMTAIYQRPSVEHIVQLADSLADVHLGVRRQARGHLLSLAADKTWKELVLREGTRLLAGADWRGLEQATLLLVQLDHKAAAPRLVALLPHARPEVKVGAAWGLRKLAVAETLPAVLDYVAPALERLLTKDPSDLFIVDHQLSQLNQFLGAQRHAPAAPLLRKFVPKHPPTIYESRAAAVWALGLILEGQTDAKLAGELAARLSDISGMPPEDGRVRWMSALTLGRLRAESALPTLRKFYPLGEQGDDPINNACGWAIAQLTGEPVKPPRTVRTTLRDWFLTPN